MSPRAATLAWARCSSPTRRRIHGPSSRTAAAASRSAARRGSTTCTPASGVDRHADAAGLGRAPDAVGDLARGPLIAALQDTVTLADMPVFPQADSAPLTDGTVALRLAAERDIPEILIAHQDDRGSGPGARACERLAQRCRARPTHRTAPTPIVRPGESPSGSRSIAGRRRAPGPTSAAVRSTSARSSRSDGRARLQVWIAPGRARPRARPPRPLALAPHAGC